MDKMPDKDAIEAYGLPEDPFAEQTRGIRELQDSIIPKNQKRSRRTRDQILRQLMALDAGIHAKRARSPLPGRSSGVTKPVKLAAVASQEDSGSITPSHPTHARKVIADLQRAIESPE